MAIEGPALDLRGVVPGNLDDLAKGFAEPVGRGAVDFLGVERAALAFLIV